MTISQSQLPNKPRGWAPAGVALLGSATALAAWDVSPGEPGKPLLVVVHVDFDDAVRQGKGLKNVENILKAAGADGTAVGVEVVCHSDGIVLLEKAGTTFAGGVDALQKKGVRFAACENTMRQRSLRLGDLLPGITTVPSGAYEVVRRQQEGYSYFKP